MESRSRRSPALEVSLARAVEILDRLGFEPRAGQGTIDVRVPADALPRRHARDRRDRGDRAHPRARAACRRCSPVGSGGGLTARAARAPHRRRRVPRRRPDRGADALVRAWPTRRTGSAWPRDDPRRQMLRRRQPALAGSLAPAHAAPAEPARGARAQRRAGDATTSPSSRSRTPTTRSRASSCPREPWTFGAVMRGRLGGAAWRRAGEPASFFLGKGVLESILGAVGVTCRVEAHERASTTRSCTPAARASCRCRARRRSASSASCTR